MRATATNALANFVIGVSVEISMDTESHFAPLAYRTRLLFRGTAPETE
jgi:hypothetical protein